MTSFDGIWLDMNEVTSFCAENAGECPTDKLTSNVSDSVDWTAIFNPQAPNSKNL